MIYGMLLWPHANSRYQDAVKPLALGEMALLLQSAGLKAQPEWTRPRRRISCGLRPRR